MMPLANRPMMEHVVRLLASHGFDDVVVTVAFLANQIRDYFGDGSDFGVRMRYATEETRSAPLAPSSTRPRLDDVPGDLGDVLTDIDLGAIVKAHQDAGALASSRSSGSRTARVRDRDHPSRRHRALPREGWGEVFSDTANTGIYVLEPGIFDFIRADEVVDFAGDVFPAVLEKKLPLIGTVVDGYWEDVGTLEAYLRAHQDVLDGAPTSRSTDSGSARGSGSGRTPTSTARIEGPVVIGDNCRIEAGAHLREYTVLGTDVVVKSDAFVERAVCHDHVYVGPSAPAGCVIGTFDDLRPRPHRRGRRRRRRVFRRRASRHQPGRQGVRSRRSRTVPSSTRRSCGRAAARTLGRQGIRGWPTSTSRRRSRSGSRRLTALHSRRAPPSPSAVTPAGSHGR